MPTPTINFQGPDLDAILAKFQTLSLSSIAQALQLIIQFVQGLSKPGTTIGDLMGEKLPLINQSLGDIINVASSITNEIQAAITSPASAVQQLNNVLEAAFGLPTPSATVSEAHAGLGRPMPEVEHARAHRRWRHLHDQLHDEQRLDRDDHADPVQHECGERDPDRAEQARRRRRHGHEDRRRTRTTITFNHPGTRAPFSTNVSNLARGPPILTWNNGEIDFNFDLKTSVQKTVPFDLNLSDLIGSGGLADIANALIGLGGSGSLTLDASADLHIVLGLQLGQHLDIGDGQDLNTDGGQHAITLTNNATGGTFTIAYPDVASGLAHNISTAALTTALQGLGLTVTNVSLASGTYTINLGDSPDLSKLSIDAQLADRRRAQARHLGRPALDQAHDHRERRDLRRRVHPHDERPPVQRLGRRPEDCARRSDGQPDLLHRRRELLGRVHERRVHDRSRRHAERRPAGAAEGRRRRAERHAAAVRSALSNNSTGGTFTASVQRRHHRRRRSPTTSPPTRLQARR